MTSSPLTHDQAKAAEAAFRGLPIDPRWSVSACTLYHGIVAATNGQDIVTGIVMDSDELSDAAVPLA